MIDLEMAGLLDLWFQLGHETHTTDQIRRQLEEGGHEGALTYIRTEVIIERRFSGDELFAIGELMNSCRSGPDFNDCSILFLALELEACLLTGDGALRKESEERAVEVRGTIWIFDQLIETGLLLPKVAADKLQGLLDRGRFLPVEISKQRIEDWRKTGK